MKSHMLLLRKLLQECGSRCCTSTSLDYKTIERRVKDEGYSFLTITLPNFGKDLEKGLDQGKVDSSLFVGYSKSGYLPRFLGGFTSLVFDKRSGLLLDNPSIDAIRSIRQISLMFGKVEIACSDARIQAAINNYVECEQQVRISDTLVSVFQKEDIRRISDLLFRDVLLDLDLKVYEGSLIPKHGPGATADKLKGNRKFKQTEWTVRLEEWFPHGEFLFPSWSHFCESPGTDLLDPGAERPVKVITVPKTLKTPRIIAVEPTAMQYAQQALLEPLVFGLETDDIVSPLIGFTDQSPNQRMACEGSLTGALATLDLSEASDRVSNQHVRNQFASFRSFSGALDACRSRKADIPGFGVKRLAKFASMGSALCFPIEAMVFVAIVFYGIERELGKPLTRETVKQFHGRVRVYGDDIIVPVDYVHSVVSALEAFGLKVNAGKSFWTGKFRESCGKEYYNGADVSIVRVRRVFPTQRKHVSEIVSVVSLRNQLYKAYYWDTCKHLDQYIERLIPFPAVAETSPALGKHDFWTYDCQKTCSYLQRPLVKAYVVSAVPPRDHLDGAGALLKYFLKRGDQPFADTKHLERAGRPSVVDIKLRWVPSY